jgi:cell division protein ZapE
MILGPFMQKLFDRGVTLVATSNIQPDLLYDNGLQRQRFLPAIAAINANTQVVELDSGKDYRLRLLESASIYWVGEPDIGRRWMQKRFNQLVTVEGHAEADLRDIHLEDLSNIFAEEIDGSHIHVNGRLIDVMAENEGLLWCTFDDLCRTARSSGDYLELARCYHTLLLEDVPQMTPKDEDATRRFINLVDEFYDASVKLIISSKVDIEDLYQGALLEFEIRRTKSRLIEMQSHDYLAEPHKPH